MSEKKEKQFAVLRYSCANDGKLWVVPSSIVWFDSRSEARSYAQKRRPRSKSHYVVVPMTRGPRS